MLGKIINVVVDRPLGSYHPIHKNIYYPVNYGYISGVMASDGEEQDVYILGVKVPLKEFRGKVIAIIHRKNDVEDKFVVAPDKMLFSKQEILQAVHFQEQYFEIEIEM